MSIRGVILYTTPPDFVAKQITRLIKDTLQSQVNIWHQKMAPKHFDRGAKTVYGYKPRDARYQKSKAAIKHHQIDLVWSGELKRQALRSIRVSGTSKSARGAMPVPKYAYQYRPGTPNKSEEITKTTNQEALELARNMDRELQAAISNLRQTKKVVV